MAAVKEWGEDLVKTIQSNYKNMQFLLLLLCLHSVTKNPFVVCLNHGQLYFSKTNSSISDNF